jgi:hypothetical protein
VNSIEYFFSLLWTPPFQMSVVESCFVSSVVASTITHTQRRTVNNSSSLYPQTNTPPQRVGCVVVIHRFILHSEEFFFLFFFFFCSYFDTLGNNRLFGR